MTKPLEGLKVLELGTLIAGPFAGRLFADFGAEVIKVENEGTGDPLRKWRVMEGDTSLWWYVQARNKKSVSLNLKSTEGQEIIKKLVEEVGIVIENFRPGKLEEWNIGYEELKKINPKIILVRISGFGQTGPLRNLPGFGSIGEAMGGLRYLTGYPDLPPTRVGLSIGDSISSPYAIIGAFLALYHRDRHGEGQIVDVALYEAVFSLTESLVPEFDRKGIIRERAGSILPGITPSNIYRTKDGKYIVIGANGDSIFKRLMILIGKSELADDIRFETNDKRTEHADYLDNVINEWSITYTIDDALKLLNDNGVPASKIFSIEDIFKEPHYLARNMLIDVEVESIGSVKMPGIVPKLSATPGKVEWAGPKIGQHTKEVIGKYNVK